MTNQYTGSNQLCDKLRYKFKDRGINKIAAVNSSAPRNNTRQGAKKTVQKTTQRPVSKVAPQINFDGKYSVAYARGMGIKMRAERFNSEAYERRHGISKNQSTLTVKKSFTDVVKERVSKIFSRDNLVVDGERKVKSKPVPKGFVASLLLCTVLLLVVISTYASYTEANAELRELQDEQTLLLEERDKVANLLSVRDDIREIEIYATEEIGMVKSDYVETRHVSVAGGERMEIIEVPEEETPDNLFSTLLSAMGGYRERILEYID